MPEATMQAQIIEEMTRRYWLIDHSRPGLDMSPQGVVKLVQQGLVLQRSGAINGDGGLWRWLHQQLSKKYRTALQGMAGKPDLLCVRPPGGMQWAEGVYVPSQAIPRTIHVELKTLEGKVTDEQMRWLRSLAEAGDEAWIVDPSNLGEFYAAVIPLDSPPLPGLHAPDTRR